MSEKYWDENDHKICPNLLCNALTTNLSHVHNFSPEKAIFSKIFLFFKIHFYKSFFNHGVPPREWFSFDLTWHYANVGAVLSSGYKNERRISKVEPKSLSKDVKGSNKRLIWLSIFRWHFISINQEFLKDYKIMVLLTLFALTNTNFEDIVMNCHWLKWTPLGSDPGSAPIISLILIKGHIAFKTSDFFPSD